MSESMTNILFFDTETTEDGKHLIDIGAVSKDGASIHTSDRNAFASFAAEHEYLCGHNILSHDRKYVDEELLARRKVLKDSEKTIRDELNGIDNEIKAKIGSASTAVCGAYKISFKEQSTSGIDRKRIAKDFPTLDFKNYATRTRVLRVSSPKEKSA